MNKRLPGSGTLWVEHAGTQQLQIELPKLLNLLGGGEKREEKKSLMVTVILSGGTGNSTNSLQLDLRPKANKISSRSLRFRDWFRPVNALEGMRKVNAQVFVLLYVIYIRYHHSQESFASKLMYNSTQGGFKHRGNGSVSDVHTVTHSSPFHWAAYVCPNEIVSLGSWPPRACYSSINTISHDFLSRTRHLPISAMLRAIEATINCRILERKWAQTAGKRHRSW